MPPAAPAASPQIPDYELLRVVGRGAYGDVWLARSLTGLYRAIKVVWRERFPEPQPYEREFNGLREFARVSINEHRQLALLHVGRNDAAGFFYYVMELADDADNGRNIIPEEYRPLTLKRFLERERRLPVPDVVAHAVELCRALASLHAYGLVHRDIKPSNVILVEGLPKLADIGMVAIAAEAVTFVGTEGFVPPEGPGTPAADVYSLGKVVYELAMGRDRNDYPLLPVDLHERKDRAELLELNEVIVRACDPSPAVRYADAAGMLKELLLLQAGRSVRRLRLTERGLARARRLAATLSIVAAVAFAGVFLERQRGNREGQLRRVAEAERDEMARLTLYSAGLAQAQRALELEDYGRARQLLRELVPAAAATPDLIGFEWRALWHEAQGDPGEVIRESGPTVERVYFSNDGRLIAIHDASKVTTVMETGSFKVTQRVPAVHRLCGFSDDNRWLLGSTDSLQLQGWDILSGKPIGENQTAEANIVIDRLAGGGAQILSLVYARDGQVYLRVWDLATEQEIRSWIVEDAPKQIRDFRFAGIAESPGDCRLILQREQGPFAELQELVLKLDHKINVVKWPKDETRTSPAAPNGEVMASLSKPTWWDHVKVENIRAVAYSPDNSRVALGTTDGATVLIEAANGQHLHTLRGFGGTITWLAWSPDGETLVAADTLGHIRAWSHPFVTADRTIALPVQDQPEQHIAFTSDSRYLAVTGIAGQTALFSVHSTESVAVLPNVGRVFGTVSDGMICFDSTGRLTRWNKRSHESTEQLALKEADLVEAFWEPNTGLLYAIDNQDRLIVCDVTLNGSITILPAAGQQLRHLQVRPQGRAVAVVANRILLQLIPASKDAKAIQLQMPHPVTSLRFSPDGEHIVAALNNGEIRIFGTQNGELKRILRVSSSGLLAMSSNGTRMFCATRNGLLHVFRTTDWREKAILVSDSNSAQRGRLDPLQLEVSPDGETVAVLRRDGTIYLWRAP